MARASRETAIDAPAAEVWAALADFDAVARWTDAVDHSCALTEATGGIGATRRVQRGARALTETIDEWAPPRRLAYRIDGLPAIVGEVRNRWVITPRGDGCVVEVTAEAVPDAGVRAAVAARVITLALGRVDAGMAADLKTHVERTEHTERTERTDQEGRP